MERLFAFLMRSWKGGEMSVGALLRTWGAGGFCKPEMHFLDFFSGLGVWDFGGLVVCTVGGFGGREGGGERRGGFKGGRGGGERRGGFKGRGRGGWTLEDEIRG